MKKDIVWVQEEGSKESSDEIKVAEEVEVSVNEGGQEMEVMNQEVNEEVSARLTFFASA